MPPTCSRTYIHTCTYTHNSHPHTLTWLCTLTCTHIPLHTNTCTPNPHIPLHTHMATDSSSHTRMHTPRDINTYVPYLLTHTHTPLVTCYALLRIHHNPQVGTLERSPSEGRTTHWSLLALPLPPCPFSSQLIYASITGRVWGKKGKWMSIYTPPFTTNLVSGKKKI